MALDAQGKKVPRFSQTIQVEGESEHIVVEAIRPKRKLQAGDVMLKPGSRNAYIRIPADLVGMQIEQEQFRKNTYWHPTGEKHGDLRRRSEERRARAAAQAAAAGGAAGSAAPAA